MTRIVTILRAIRMIESIPFCGVALLGGLLSREGSFGIMGIIPWPLIFAVSSVFFLAAFAFTFNDLQDIEPDRRSGSKSERPLVTGALSVRSARIISTAFAASGIALLVAVTPWFVVCVGLSIIPVSMLYSWRVFPLKSVPVFSSLVHLVFGSLTFVLGAWSVNGPDPISPIIGAYFGLLFAAGHLHHEVTDLEADRRSGIRTHAVRFGPKPTLRAGFVLWFLSCVFFSILSVLQHIPISLEFIQLGMYAFYLFGFFALLRGRHDHENMLRLRSLYRAVYTFGGLAMVFFLIF